MCHNLVFYTRKSYILCNLQHTKDQVALLLTVNSMSIYVDVAKNDSHELRGHKVQVIY